jgi:hypothetical protein
MALNKTIKRCLKITLAADEEGICEGYKWK